MKRFLLFLILVFIPIASAHAESAYERVTKTQTIRCGYIVWSPYLNRDPNSGQFSGLAFEYMDAIAKELDFKVEWTEEVGWGNMQEGINTGRYDMVCTPVYQSGQRAKAALLTRPIDYAQIFMYVRGDDNRFEKSLTSANDPSITMTVIDGDVTQAIRKSLFPHAKELAVPQFSDTAQMLLSVSTGKADIVFGNPENLRKFNASSTVKLKEAANGKPVRRFAQVFALGKGEYALKAMLDATIEALGTAGTIGKITQKYTPDFAPLPEFSPEVLQ